MKSIAVISRRGFGQTREEVTLDAIHTEPDRAAARGGSQTNIQSTRSITLKKLIIGLAVVILIGGGAYFYFARATVVDQPAVAVAAPAPAVAAGNAVVAEGRVVPARSAALS